MESPRHNNRKRTNKRGKSSRQFTEQKIVTASGTIKFIRHWIK